MAVAPMKKTTTPSGVDINKPVVKLKGPYLIRCLKSLLLSPINRSDLDYEIGTTNAPEFVRQLKLKGLIIHTEMMPFVTRDGRTTERGKYHLDPDSRELALLMLGGNDDRN